MFLFGLFVLSSSIFAGSTEKNHKTNKFSDVIGYFETKSSLVFNLPSGDVKTTIIPEGTHLIYNKTWSNTKNSERQVHPPKRNTTREFNETRPMSLGVELVVDGYEQQNNLKLVTSEIESLATLKGAHDCLVILGNQSYSCRVEKVTTVYGGFLKDGTPTFAVMNLTISRFARVKR